MTNTVLDVTVMLLCVSASVVALGTVESGIETEEYAAADAADRLATETATVTYEIDGGDHESRTVHATLVELLATAVREPPGTDGGIGDRFRSRVIERVTDALGGRTRIDVRYETGAPMLTIGNEPPATAEVTAAVLTHPGSERIEGDGPGRFRIVVRAW
ncbi:DUF7284 family protein [Halorubrum cibi]|uniref:Uncharacterized protein n=1 Tax=Halorubrum cibi TaxID=413815 RepID=A0A521AN02_9EURY|nr:hypothetical protein [Halorubrum cibi]SMO36193.1 hypothetical protein SAMN06264867_101265 [Halorubrum cibi]